MTKVDIYEDVSIIEVTSGGIQGPKGDKGDGAATVTVGTTTTGNAGTNASVTNSGTVNDVVLNFTIPQGIKGDKGDPGIPGTNGTNGINGTNGLDGADGDSAYQVAVNNGFVGTEQQWLESLVGETGAQGAPGLPGTNGTNGADGADGAPGVGVIPGGTAGQVLTKIDSTDYNTQWSTIDLSTKQDVVSGVSSTEIGYLDGVTSSIQTQLNAKQATINPGTGLTFNTYSGIPYLEIDQTSNINVTGLTVSGSADFTGATITGLPTTSAATPTVLGTVYGKTVSGGTYNVSLGQYALNSATTSNDNVAIGDSALKFVTDYFSQSNTAIGTNAMLSGLNIMYNTGVGKDVLASLETGNSNTAIGEASLASISSSGGNTAVGSSTLTNLSSGDNNTVLGSSAGTNLTSGSNNLIIGRDAEASAASVSNEITLGNSLNDRLRIPGLGIDWTPTTIPGAAATPIALGTVYGKTMSNVPFTNTTLGYNALPNPTISGGSGVNNIAIGAESLFSHTTGNSNIAIGPNAMYSNTTGTGNTAVGRDALSLNTTGQWNIAIGQNSGNSLTTGINNIIVGYNSSASSATVSNEITLGNANISRFRIPGMEIDWSYVISDETTTVPSAPTATTNYELTTDRNVRYHTVNATNNWVLNLRGNDVTTYDSISLINKAVTIVFMNTNGATAYYPTAFQIDGTARTVKWQGGTAPSAGNANSIDVYTYVVIKTAANTYTVLGSQTKFA